MSLSEILPCSLFGRQTVSVSCGHQRQILHIWSGSGSGRLSVFGHIARLTQGTPAHNAQHCQVGLASGRSLGGHWRRRPGCPRARWTDQLRNDTGSVPANLWRQTDRQTDRPFYGDMVERRDGPSWLRDDDDDDDDDCFRSLVVSFIHSRLDYGNFILVGLLAYLQRRFQVKSSQVRLFLMLQLVWCFDFVTTNTSPMSSRYYTGCVSRNG